MIVVTMKRNGMLLLVLLLLLVTAAAAAEGTAENPDPATPTDLTCAHENTKEYVYYENPEYIRVNTQYHKVVGYDAVVRVVCLDCGETISEETRDRVEEIRNHVFRNGACAMCSCPQPVVILDFTQEEIEERMDRQEKVLVLRPDGSPAAIAVPVDSLRDILVKNPDKTFRAELQPRPDGSFSIVLYLADGQEEDPFYPEGAEVRFYTRDDTPEILFTTEEGTAHKSKTVFVDNTTPSQRYWFVPFIGNGMYKP